MLREGERDLMWPHQGNGLPQCVRKSTCLTVGFLKAKLSGASLSCLCRSLDFLYLILLCSALLHWVSGERGAGLGLDKEKEWPICKKYVKYIKKEILIRGFKSWWFSSCPFQTPQLANLFSTPNTELELSGISRCVVLAPKAVEPFLAKPL